MPRSDSQQRLHWTTGALDLTFTWSDTTPVVLDSWTTAAGRGAAGEATPGAGAPPSSDTLWGVTQPLVEVLLLGWGREWNNTRLTHTAAGALLRHVSHRATQASGRLGVEIVQEAQTPRLRATTTLQSDEDGRAVRVRTRIDNLGQDPIHLEAVSTLALGCLLRPGSTPTDLDLVSGVSAHLAENRWNTRPLMGPGGLADIHPHRHANQCGRGWVDGTGHSTWSTEGDLPTALLVDRRRGDALAWQIETDSPWRWEVNARREGTDALSLVLSGPDDRHHAAGRTLAPGEVFDTVPASVAFSSEGRDGALRELTRHRRWLRRLSDTRDVPIVYNDYMNTLDGDPSEEVDLSLARVAAEVGAEVFCVDAGWYADPGVNWWASVGDWEMSRLRFPAGVAGWCEQIRELGLTPGIWMEPGVVGVDSRAAGELPESAFLGRSGVRVREQDRYILDFRDPAARAHVDAAVDRLVASGIGYFKFDDNVTPGLGSDAGGLNPGAGLLEHVRAQNQWLRAVRRRHPEVVIENCSSGAMRSDFARLEVLDLQSTSDQQDPLLYPVIAASSPMLMPPEVAANWAYPQPEMSPEQIAFTMVTGLAGTPYLAGFLDRMSGRQLALVREGMDAHRAIRADLEASTPFWPLGLPHWEDPVVVLGLHAPDRDLLCVWDRVGVDHIDLDLGVGADRVRTLYPVDLPQWGLEDVEDASGFGGEGSSGSGGGEELPGFGGGERPSGSGVGERPSGSGGGERPSGIVRLRPVRPGIGDVGSARLLEVRPQA